MKYAEYKQTGTLWIESVPAEWRCQKIASLFTQRKTKVSDKDYPALSVAKIGVVPQLENAVKTDAGDNRKLVCAGDFVINSRSDRKGSCGVAEQDGSVSLINIVLTPRQEWNTRYVYYLLRSQPFAEEFYHYGRGIVADLWTTRYCDMKNIMLPVPPREEQDQIVCYLDWQVSKINKLIAAKKKQIGLLHDLEQLIVANKITHGIDNDEETIDSGVDWIGYIPSHWQVMRCKYIFRERDERSVGGNETHLSMSQKYGLVPDTQLDERRMLSESYSGGKLCYENDLVLNRLKAHLGVFALAPQHGVISPDYTVLMPNTERILPSFGEAVLKSTKCRRELRIRVRGIIEGFWRLYTDDFYTIKLPIPSLEQQAAIMQYLAAQHENTKAYEESIRNEIDVLYELRARLVSDVITGQIDVRGIEVPGFDMVEEIGSDEEGLDEGDTDEETEEQEE